MDAVFHIRAYVDDDFDAVAEVYRNAVETLARSAYTDEQVRMWASYPDDGDDFRMRLGRGGVVVAKVEREIAAFGQLEPDDHVAFLYCKGAFARRGLATEIYFRMEARARLASVPVLRTEASRVSRGFFEGKDFAVDEVENSVRGGVTFERFKMTKRLS
jgi:putative acetyltransferase